MSTHPACCCSLACLDGVQLALVGGAQHSPMERGLEQHWNGQGEGEAVTEGGQCDALSWDGLVFAVPKRRTTRSVKRMRMANKYLKPMENITTCAQCGSRRLQHHLCLKCVAKATRRVRKERRELMEQSDAPMDGAH